MPKQLKEGDVVVRAPGVAPHRPYVVRRVEILNEPAQTHFTGVAAASFPYTQVELVEIGEERLAVKGWFGEDEVEWVGPARCRGEILRGLDRLDRGELEYWEYAHRWLLAAGLLRGIRIPWNYPSPDVE